MAKVTSNVKSTVAKKVEEVVKPVAKAVETKVEEVKAEVAEKVEAAPAKEEKKAAAKPAKKAAAKPAKKEEATAEVYVQYGGGETSVAAVVEKIKAAYVEQGHRASSIKSLNVYLKPEDGAAYYVINDKFDGRVDLF